MTDLQTLEKMLQGRKVAGGRILPLPYNTDPHKEEDMEYTILVVVNGDIEHEVCFMFNPDGSFRNVGAFSSGANPFDVGTF